MRLRSQPSRVIDEDDDDDDGDEDYEDDENDQESDDDDDDEDADDSDDQDEVGDEDDEDDDDDQESDDDDDDEDADDSGNQDEEVDEDNEDDDDDQESDDDDDDEDVDDLHSSDDEDEEGKDFVSAWREQKYSHDTRAHYQEKFNTMQAWIRRKKFKEFWPIEYPFKAELCVAYVRWEMRRKKRGALLGYGHLNQVIQMLKFEGFARHGHIMPEDLKETLRNASMVHKRCVAARIGQGKQNPADSHAQNASWSAIEHCAKVLHDDWKPGRQDDDRSNMYLLLGTQGIARGERTGKIITDVFDLGLGGDHICAGEGMTTKTDQTGQRSYGKRFLPNSKKPHMCLVTALGRYLVTCRPEELSKYLFMTKEEARKYSASLRSRRLQRFTRLRQLKRTRCIGPHIKFDRHIKGVFQGMPASERMRLGISKIKDVVGHCKRKASFKRATGVDGVPTASVGARADHTAGVFSTYGTKGIQGVSNSGGPPPMHDMLMARALCGKEQYTTEFNDVPPHWDENFIKMIPFSKIMPCYHKLPDGMKKLVPLALAQVVYHYHLNLVAPRSEGYLHKKHKLFRSPLWTTHQKLRDRMFAELRGADTGKVSTLKPMYQDKLTEQYIWTQNILHQTEQNLQMSQIAVDTANEAKEISLENQRLIQRVLHHVQQVPSIHPVESRNLSLPQIESSTPPSLAGHSPASLNSSDSQSQPQPESPNVSNPFMPNPYDGYDSVDIGWQGDEDGFEGFSSGHRQELWSNSEEIRMFKSRFNPESGMLSIENGLDVETAWYYWHGGTGELPWKNITNKSSCIPPKSCKAERRSVLQSLNKIRHIMAFMQGSTSDIDIERDVSFAWASCKQCAMRTLEAAGISEWPFSGSYQYVYLQLLQLAKAKAVSMNHLRTRTVSLHRPRMKPPPTNQVPITHFFAAQGVELEVEQPTNKQPPTSQVALEHFLSPEGVELQPDLTIESDFNSDQDEGVSNTNVRSLDATALSTLTEPLPPEDCYICPLCADSGGSHADGVVYRTSTNLWQHWEQKHKLDDRPPLWKVFRVLGVKYLTRKSASWVRLPGAMSFTCPEYKVKQMREDILLRRVEVANGTFVELQPDQESRSAGHRWFAIVRDGTVRDGCLLVEHCVVDTMAQAQHAHVQTVYIESILEVLTVRNVVKSTLPFPVSAPHQRVSPFKAPAQPSPSSLRKRPLSPGQPSHTSNDAAPGPRKKLKFAPKEARSSPLEVEATSSRCSPRKRPLSPGQPSHISSDAAPSKRPLVAAFSEPPTPESSPSSVHEQQRPLSPGQPSHTSNDAAPGPRKKLKFAPKEARSSPLEVEATSSRCSPRKRPLSPGQPSHISSDAAPSKRPLVAAFSEPPTPESSPSSVHEQRLSCNDGHSLVGVTSTSGIPRKRFLSPDAVSTPRQRLNFESSSTIKAADSSLSFSYAQRSAPKAAGQPLKGLNLSDSIASAAATASRQTKRGMLSAIDPHQLQYTNAPLCAPDHSAIGESSVPVCVQFMLREVSGSNKSIRNPIPDFTSLLHSHSRTITVGDLHFLEDDFGEHFCRVYPSSVQKILHAFPELEESYRSFFIALGMGAGLDPYMLQHTFRSHAPRVSSQCSKEMKGHLQTLLEPGSVVNWRILKVCWPAAFDSFRILILDANNSNRTSVIQTAAYRKNRDIILRLKDSHYTLLHAIEGATTETLLSKVQVVPITLLSGIQVFETQPLRCPDMSAFDTFVDDKCYLSAALQGAQPRKQEMDKMWFDATRAAGLEYDRKLQKWITLPDGLAEIGSKKSATTDGSMHADSWVHLQQALLTALESDDANCETIGRNIRTPPRASCTSLGDIVFMDAGSESGNGMYRMMSDQRITHVAGVELQKAWFRSSCIIMANLRRVFKENHYRMPAVTILHSDMVAVTPELLYLYSIAGLLWMNNFVFHKYAPFASTTKNKNKPQPIVPKVTDLSTTAAFVFSRTFEGVTFVAVHNAEGFFDSWNYTKYKPIKVRTTWSEKLADVTILRHVKRIIIEVEAGVKKCKAQCYALPSPALNYLNLWDTSMKRWNTLLPRMYTAISKDRVLTAGREALELRKGPRHINSDCVVHLDSDSELDDAVAPDDRSRQESTAKFLKGMPSTPDTCWTHLLTLTDSTWLPQDVLNGYMLLLQKKYPEIYFCNLTLTVKLKKLCGRKVVIGFMNLCSCHWIAVKLDLAQNYVAIADSLCTTFQREHANVFKKLEAVATNIGHKSQLRRCTVDVPNQSNTSDCGVLASLFMTYMAQSEIAPNTKMTYDTKPTARLMRKRIFADLMAGKITTLQCLN